MPDEDVFSKRAGKISIVGHVVRNTMTIVAVTPWTRRPYSPILKFQKARPHPYVGRALRVTDDGIAPRITIPCEPIYGPHPDAGRALRGTEYGVAPFPKLPYSPI